MRPILALAVALALVLPMVGGTAMPAYAVQPDEVLDDPKLEARAREISKDIRCLVCQNQSIDDSNAELAQDLRVLVRERLKAGDTNQEVKDYLVARYGEYVLLQPPMTLETALLWMAPALLVGAGAVGVFFWYRGRRREAVRTAAGVPGDALSEEERARLDALLAEMSGADGDGADTGKSKGKGSPQ